MDFCALLNQFKDFFLLWLYKKLFCLKYLIRAGQITILIVWWIHVWSWIKFCKFFFRERQFSMRICNIYNLSKFWVRLCRVSLHSIMRFSFSDLIYSIRVWHKSLSISKESIGSTWIVSICAEFMAGRNILVVLPFHNSHLSFTLALDQAIRAILYLTRLDVSIEFFFESSILVICILLSESRVPRGWSSTNFLFLFDSGKSLLKRFFLLQFIFVCRLRYGRELLMQLWLLHRSFWGIHLWLRRSLIMIKSSICHGHFTLSVLLITTLVSWLLIGRTLSIWAKSWINQICESVLTSFS